MPPRMNLMTSVMLAPNEQMYTLFRLPAPEHEGMTNSSGVKRENVVNYLAK